MSMSSRKELIAFFVVAAAALGSILSFALTSHRREAQSTPGTLVQAAAVGGTCPAELKVRHGEDMPLMICPAACSPAPGAPGQCDCTIYRDKCRNAGTAGQR
jgi:hypothetical protein